MRIVAGVRAEDRSPSRGTRTVASPCGFETKDTSRRGDARPRCPIFPRRMRLEVRLERERTALGKQSEEKATAAARSSFSRPPLKNFHLFFRALLPLEI
jgi:hypothetical protein